MINCCWGYDDELNKCNNQARNGGIARGYCDYHWGYSNGLWRALETFCGLHWTETERIVQVMMDKPGTSILYSEIMNELRSELKST